MREGAAFAAGPSFVAVDVETAAENPGSICQIGLVRVRNGRITGQTALLVNPETRFREFNVELHGISELTVRHSPALPAVYPGLARQLAGQVVVSHTGFDRNALSAAAARYGLAEIRADWLDSARVARRAWPRKYRRRWSLGLIAADLGIAFRHHDAAEDARAAAEIVLAACREHNVGLEHWLPRR